MASNWSENIEIGVTASAADPDAVWLKMAQDANSRSTTYFEANYRKTWQDNLRMFQSRHPQDSKYNSSAYQYRSKLFRPKSRSAVRKIEATAAMGFFSNPDVVSVDPTDASDEFQVASSVAMKELLQYRLTKSIPWFLTVVGGVQDAANVGIVASFQYWDYKTKKIEIERSGQMPDGSTVTIKIPQEKVITDKPCVHLLAIENIRFDPAAHWYDVAATSPYVIVEMPMYVRDVLDNMEADGPYKWKKYDKTTILQAKVKVDPTRLIRQDDREDPDEVTSNVNEFDVVMVHLNFIRTGPGETVCFYTLQDKKMLTEALPLEEMFLHCENGELPVKIGFCVVETHKAVPSSMIGLGSELQREANEIVNQRLDNVKLVLNKKALFRRGANIDVKEWLRNVPGGAIMVNDIEKDVRTIDYQDVTSSAYAEQDRVNVDMDDLMGNFAQSSVMTNRKLNETVGGMRMMSQGANMLTEYTIRVLVETWVEPVLRQLVKMEARYETDATILAICGKKAQLQRYKQDQITDEMLNQDMTLTVNVGMGATDPEKRLAGFTQAFGIYNQIAMSGAPDIDLPELRKELFGLAGWKNATRFFQSEVDPRIVMLQRQNQQVQQQAQNYVTQANQRIQRRERQLDQREKDIEIKQITLDDAEDRLSLTSKLAKEEVSHAVATAEKGGAEGSARSVNVMAGGNPADDATALELLELLVQQESVPI